MTNQQNCTPTPSPFTAEFLAKFTGNPDALAGLRELGSTLAATIEPTAGGTIEEVTRLRLELAAAETLALATWIFDLSDPETVEALKSQADYGAARSLDFAGQEGLKLGEIARRLHELAADPTVKELARWLCYGCAQAAALAQGPEFFTKWKAEREVEPGPCPDHKGLAGYAEDDLPPAERASVAEHLSRCCSCASVMLELIASPQQLACFALDRLAGRLRASLAELRGVAIQLEHSDSSDAREWELLGALHCLVREDLAPAIEAAERHVAAADDLAPPPDQSRVERIARGDI